MGNPIFFTMGKYIFPYIRKPMGTSFPYLGIVWVVRLNTFLVRALRIYSVSLRIQSECGKIREKCRPE